MLERPRIAIAEIGYDFVSRCLKRYYRESVERAGARPEWIRGPADGDTLRRISRSYDGFLFPGGSDIDPSLYGESPSPRCGKLNRERDLFEPWLLRAALEARKPVLGICRGFQLINVVMGGALRQDLKADLPEAAPRHLRLTKMKGTAHSVAVREGSLLSRCVGVGNLDVNSLHHQAARSIPDTLVPSAISEDGIVEGLESTEYSFLLGVQWHPELLSERRPLQQEIFNAFVRACRGASASPDGTDDQDFLERRPAKSERTPLYTACGRS